MYDIWFIQYAHMKVEQGCSKRVFDWAIREQTKRWELVSNEGKDLTDWECENFIYWPVWPIQSHEGQRWSKLLRPCGVGTCRATWMPTMLFAWKSSWPPTRKHPLLPLVMATTLSRDTRRAKEALLAPSGALIAIPTYYWPTTTTPTFSDHTGPQHWTFTFWATTAI